MAHHGARSGVAKLTEGLNRFPQGAVLMAIERGTLQHLVFDNQVLGSHRALAALLGVILRPSSSRSRRPPGPS